MPMACARTVFRCFRTFEYFADRVTGAAGPYFVGLAVVLITAGTLCFFTIILPSLPFPLIAVPICFLIVVNLYLQYLWACITPPGFADEPEISPDRTVTGRFWAKRHGRRQNLTISQAYVGKCAKCGSDKPERTHHCRICKRCILKYDHHCPVRINQCVGLHNERHFVLFMVYFVLSTASFSGFGYQHFFLALGIHLIEWPYFLPPWVFVLVYLLSSVLGLAVAIMLSFHLWSIALAETSIESQDFPTYRSKAKSRGATFVNCYDLGKRQNLQLFFNVGPLGQHSYLTLVLPFRTLPYTNGHEWAKRPDFARHHGIDASDEFTDDEEHSTAP